MSSPDLSVSLAGIKMSTPLLAASGPFGYGNQYCDLVDFKYLGAIIVKGVSLEPWAGNPPPRLAETASGVLNSIGLQNPGLDCFLKKELPRLRDFGLPIIVNVIGKTVEDYASVVEGLNRPGDIAAIEVNISCPNLKAGGMAFGTDPRQTYEVVSALRKRTDLPLLVKLSPNVTDIRVIALAAEKAGADGLSLINTLSGMLIDVKSKKPSLGNIFGGLSGPAIMPVALKMVWQVAEVVKIPILGMGGITAAEDALQFIMAGATAVAVGTGFFYDPHLPEKIIKGLEHFLGDENVSSLQEMTGIAQKGVT